MNRGVATADGGMLAHKGETMNETLVTSGYCDYCRRGVTYPHVCKVVVGEEDAYDD